MNGATFLSQLNGIITGLGFIREKSLPIRDFHLDSSGADLTTTISTNPGWDKLGTNMTGLAWAAAKVVAAGYNFSLPLDYDKTNDYLRIKIKCKMAGSTNTPTIAVAAYKDSAPTTDLAPAAITALSSTAVWKEINLDSKGLAGGDVIHFNLTPAAHGTDALEVYGIKIEYKSDLVAYDMDDRS